MPRRSDRSGGRLLDLMALFGALGIVAAVASAWLGLTPLIVAGSSMEPAVPLGSLAIARSTPADRVAKLNAAAVASLASEEVRSRLSTFGMNIRSSTPAEAAAFVRAETVKWTSAIRQAGIEPE